MREALKELRKRAGMNQADVAAALNVQQSTVAMWENGENKPRADKLPEIAKLFHCTIDDLYDLRKEA